MEFACPAIYCTFTLWYVLLADCKTVELYGAGASFPSVVYTEWLNLYSKERVRHVYPKYEYDSVGSGAGKARIKGEQLPEVHYAGSDTRLTDEEKAAFPDLEMFPTLAGAIVMIYNIPGLKHLNLNLEAIVGIYNGTIETWDDPVIANLNPTRTMPAKKIVVLARSDKSGTTASFTSGLSAYSSDWKDTYGVFSVGRDEKTRQPVIWDSDTVKLLGHTNQGMTGLVLSIDYTLGYVDIANALSSRMTYATLQNSAGNLVDASMQTVQNAIISANGSYDINNTPGKFAYPLASFTYFIVKMSTNGNCDEAVELVRYVTWFFSSEAAQEEAIRSNMVPLDPASVVDVENNILKTMTCRDQNVWEMMLQQIRKESEIEESRYWQIPTFSCVCLLVAVATGLFVHLGRQQILLHRELLKDTWKIDSSYISLSSGQRNKKERDGSYSCFSFCSSIVDHMGEGIMFNDSTWTYGQFRVGVFNENPITLVNLHKQPLEFTLTEKKALIRMRDNIKHPNVMQLLGITQLNGIWFNVHAGNIRGSLSDILNIKRIDINTDGIVALSKSLLQGLLYLHRKGIVHGHLTGMCCLIDTSWELKLSAWTEPELETSLTVNRNKVSSISERPENDDKILLWTAPEIIKFDRRPSQASDIYSLCMVFQEMFTRKEPYSELTMSNAEIMNAVLTCGIRPHLTPETPMVFKAIMENCWDVDPAARPKLDVILSSIKAAFSVNHSFMDCIIRSVEQYARQLEERVKDQESLNAVNQVLMYQNVPKPIANILEANSKVETMTSDSLCILACNVTNMASLIRHTTHKGIVNLLNNFCSSLDQFLVQDDIYKLSRYAGQNMFVVGLQRYFNCCDETKAVGEAVRISLNLIKFAETFSKERLIGINTEVKLQIGLTAGTIILGIMGGVVPQYVALGNSVEEAMKLSRNAKTGEIRISDRVNSLLEEVNSCQIHTWISEGVSLPEQFNG